MCLSSVIEGGSNPRNDRRGGGLLALIDSNDSVLYKKPLQMEDEEGLLLWEGSLVVQQADLKAFG